MKKAKEKTAPAETSRQKKASTAGATRQKKSAPARSSTQRSKQSSTQHSTQSSTASSAETLQESFSLISDETLLGLLTAMVESRWLARRQGRVWGVRPGSEAVLAGVARRLEKGDAMAAGGKQPLVDFLRGGRLEKALTAEAARVASDKVRSRAAVRVARRLKAAGKGAVAAALTTGELNADWMETLEIAAEEKLPLLVVRECGAWEAEDLPMSVCGTPRLPVDAWDAVAVYRVATECATHARRGNGPSLIDCLHFGGAKGAGAVERMEEYLRRKGILPAEVTRETEQALGKAARRARKALNE